MAWWTSIFPTWGLDHRLGCTLGWATTNWVAGKDTGMTEAKKRYYPHAYSEVHAAHTCMPVVPRVNQQSDERRWFHYHADHIVE